MVRAARLDDARRVFDIRNHPLSRVFFHHQEPLVWEDHVAWFDRQYFSRVGHVCLVAEIDGVVSGYCRLDAREEGGRLLSVAVDPNTRGRGVASVLMREALARTVPGDSIHAEVLTSNIASRALMEKLGFRFVQEAEGVVYFIYSL